MFKKWQKNDVGTLCASLWGATCPVLLCYDPPFRLYTVVYLMPITFSESASQVQNP